MRAGNHFLLLLFLLFDINSKHYLFKAFYECQDSQFDEIFEQHTQSISYVCRKWIQKIQITQAKNTYIRFDSKVRQQQQEIEEQEQRQQEQEEDIQKEREKEEKQKRKEQREQRIKQIQQQMNKKRLQKIKQQSQQTLTDLPTNSQHHFLPQKINSNNHKQSYFNSITPSHNRLNHVTRMENPSRHQIHKKIRQNFEDISTMQQQPLKFKRENLKTISLNKSQREQSLLNKGYVMEETYGEGENSMGFQFLRHPFFDSVMPKDPRFGEGSNCLEHNFIRKRRHREEDDEEEEEQKFKPLKSHRSHPVDDILFMLEFIRMGNVIFEQSYQEAPFEQNSKSEQNIGNYPSEGQSVQVGMEGQPDGILKELEVLEQEQGKLEREEQWEEEKQQEEELEEEFMGIQQTQKVYHAKNWQSKRQRKIGKKSSGQNLRDSNSIKVKVPVEREKTNQFQKSNLR